MLLQFYACIYAIHLFRKQRFVVFFLKSGIEIWFLTVYYNITIYSYEFALWSSNDISNSFESLKHQQWSLLLYTLCIFTLYIQLLIVRKPRVTEEYRNMIVWTCTSVLNCIRIFLILILVSSYNKIVSFDLLLTHF